MFVRLLIRFGMVLPRRAGYVLLAVGIVLSLLPFVFGGGTTLACPGIDSVIYDVVGIYPAGYEVRGVDLLSFRLFWSDGCNSRTSSLVPLFLGIGVFLVGFVVARQPAEVS